MVEGILRKQWQGGPKIEASISPDGWFCDDSGVLSLLEGAFAPESTEAGEGWMLAFRKAVSALGAEVVREPEADPWPPEELQT